jgi:hypothetical protein
VDIDAQPKELEIAGVSFPRERINLREQRGVNDFYKRRC